MTESMPITLLRRLAARLTADGDEEGEVPGWPEAVMEYATGAKYGVRLDRVALTSDARDLNFSFSAPFDEPV